MGSTALVARFGARDATRLMSDAGIVRNRAKIDATINNARRYADLVEEFGSFGAYVWRYAPKPRRGLIDHDQLMKITSSDEAAAMSKDLRRRGWGFVGPTTVYSFMQAMGLVNDHMYECTVRQAATDARAKFNVP